MDFFIIIVGLLFIFAISDLIVGVSNDAVNFLNSAIGSKVSTFLVIMIIASIGVLFGATFSNGMMEVARNSIFHPEMFQFQDIMWLFLGVMLTDIILLDTFNTLGLPTSTTVSIVFELLGGAVAVAAMKIINSPDSSMTDLSLYINSSKAMLIIFGILLSVFMAFGSGAIVQYITRLCFTFNFKKQMKFFGPLFTAISLTSIIYFLLIKGAKNASFLSDDVKIIVKEHSLAVIMYSFLSLFVFLQLLYIFTKMNILKIAVLAGTFALAMAFAGNDLVNFIGVPLAGFASYEAYLASGKDPLMTMDILNAKVQTPTYMLLIAGMVMVMTLWLSKKARSVTQTTLNLSSQGQSYEQFGSSMFARTLVRATVNIGNGIRTIVPDSLLKKLENRFEPVKEHTKKAKEAASFDLVRALINLMVASILISIATAYKLPLSTTYVTFMVAMGTSFADGAWGRESAVYRVTGVITVIGGWFFTAISAFTVCGIVSMLLVVTNGWVIIVLLPLTLYLIIKSKKSHTKKEDSKLKSMEQLEAISESDMDIRCRTNISTTFTNISFLFTETIEGINGEDRIRLKRTSKNIKELNLTIKALKENINRALSEMKNISLEESYYYIQVLDYMREAAHSINFLCLPCMEHVNNQHKGFKESQKHELSELNNKVLNFFNQLKETVETDNFDNVEVVISSQQNIINLLDKFRKNQIKRIKNDITKTKSSVLYFAILQETKTLMLHSVNTLKSYRDFKTAKNID